MMRAPNTTPDQPLTDEQVEALAPYGTKLRLEPGDYLFDEKSVVDSFYVLLRGEIQISRLDGAEETPLVTHHPGDFTGGLAVLTGKRSIHRARATAPSRVLEIDSEAFRRVAVERPDVATPRRKIRRSFHRRKHTSLNFSVDKFPEVRIATVHIPERT